MTLINGRITEPIIVEEIAACIGVSSGDVRELCTSKNINPLSKYKPVESPNVRYKMTDALFADVDWGYRIPIDPINLTAFANYIRNGVIPQGWEEPLDATNGFNDMGMGWYYIRPMSKYRMLDFDKYNHNTRQSLFSTITAPEKVFSDTTSVQIDLARGVFWLHDFSRFTTNSCHLAVVVTKVEGGALYFKSATEEESGFAKVVFSQEEIRQIFSSAGEYVCYVVASADSGQNILQSGADYISGSGIGIWPLPVTSATIIYTDTTSGSSDNVLNFNIKDFIAEEKNITFMLEAYNNTSIAKEVQWVRYKIDVIDDEGNTWTSTNGNPELLKNTAYGAVVPANGTTNLGQITLPYAAYRELLAPWTVTLSLYHGQQENYNTGQYRGAGVAEYYFEG